MKILTLTLLLLFGAAITDNEYKSVHEFSMENIDGENVDLSAYEGNVLLIVNTASECGYTPQYEGLQALYEKYKDKGLVVLGFPANNFGGQEPGTDKEIKKFCSVNFDVSFPMFSKISVKGNDQHPLFDYLCSTENPDFKGEIKWNFEKFLVDKEGNLVHRFRSPVKPMSDDLTKEIENLL